MSSIDSRRDFKRAELDFTRAIDLLVDLYERVLLLHFAFPSAPRHCLSHGQTEAVAPLPATHAGPSLDDDVPSTLGRKTWRRAVRSSPTAPPF